MSIHRCPQCGAPVAAGDPDAPCLACLMHLGLTAGADTPVEFTSQTPNPGPTHIPTPPERVRCGTEKLPQPAELARLFPELEIIKLLGYGGMGAVYQARQTALDRSVALKIIMPEVAGDPGFADRFVREARVLARLNHPHIVTIHDFGLRQGLHYLIMEHVDGVNLREVLRTGKMPPSEALRIIPTLCEALQYAHDEGVVHRDIKPENILLDRKGRVKIADFGLARLAGHGSEELNLTGTRQVVGTPRYMAPEQMQGARAVDHRVDLYSLGVVFYEMLTGEVPLGRFAPPSHYAQVDARVDSIVLRTLESDPNRRYQQASDIKTDVESIADGGVPAASPTLVAPTKETVNLAPPAFFLLFVAAMQVFAGLGTLAVSLHQMRSETTVFMLFAVALSVVAVITAAIAMASAIQLFVTGSRQWLKWGAAGMLIPCSAVWLVGIAIAIWMLRSLAKRDAVSAAIYKAPWDAFREPLAGKEPAGKKSSVQLSAPWSGLEWAQKAVRRMSRRQKFGLTVGVLGMVATAALVMIAFQLFPDTSLHQAAREGHAARISLLSMLGSDINARDEQGMTPLMWAVWLRQPAVVSQLLRMRADVNVKDDGGETALIKAAYQGNLSTVQSLISHGANLDENDNNGESAILWAAAKGHVSVLQFLLKLKADPQAATRDGWTPLIGACVHGHAPVVRILLPLSRLDAVDRDGETALMKAAAFGHFGIVQELLAASANAQLTNLEGQTAQTLAIRLGHVAIADILAPQSGKPSPLYGFFKGFQQGRAGDHAAALTNLRAAVEASNPGLANPCKFAINSLKFEVPDSKCFTWLLIAECELRLGRTAEAKSALQSAAAYLPPGQVELEIFYRILEEPERRLAERFIVKADEVGKHLESPNRPWHLTRHYEDESRSAYHSRSTSGTDTTELGSLFR